MQNHKPDQAIPAPVVLPTTKHEQPHSGPASLAAAPTTPPRMLLFAQHGWADTAVTMAALTRTLAEPDWLAVATDLGYINTWLRIDPLIDRVEAGASRLLERYPDAPIRIVGHSMGGLIWIEVLYHHPSWWQRVQSLVLLASAVGGAHRGRIIDPFGWGIGIARDLGMNRRDKAEVLAAHIPTLAIAGDSDGGSDGTVTVESTRLRHATCVTVPDIAHADMRNHPRIVQMIQTFWRTGQPYAPLHIDLQAELLQRLRAVPGMTDAHRRDFARARVSYLFQNGVTLRTWVHPLGMLHVFLANAAGECVYAGYTGWIDEPVLRATLGSIARDYAPYLLPHR